MDSHLPSSRASGPQSQSGTAVETSSASQQLQHDTISAIEAYQHAICSDLAEQSIHDASDAVSSAVKRLVSQHGSEVHSLASENTELRAQLARATGVIDSLTSQHRLSTTAATSSLSRATLHTMTGDSAASLTAPMPIDTSDVHSMVSSVAGASGPSALVESEASATPTQTASRETQGVEEEEEGGDEGERASLARLVEVALPTAEMLTREPGALEAFVAHYADLRGRVQHLLTEQRLWQHHLAQLTPLLRSMTMENANFRQTLTLLKATHVPAEDLHEALKSRDEARQELRVLRLEAQRLEHELADAAAQREQHELRLRAATALTAEKAPLSVSPAPEQATATVAPYPHDGQWALAMRELEEQAIIAANQQQLRDQLAEARAETERLQTENGILREALTAAQAEEVCLREDAQNGVFRNGVLSQQVASLLVKVERLRREARTAAAAAPEAATGATASTFSAPPAHPCSPLPERPRASSSTSSSTTARGFGGPEASTRVPLPSGRQHTVAWGARPPDTTATACAAAVASTQLLRDPRRAGSGASGGGAQGGGASWLLLNGSASALGSEAAVAPSWQPAHRLSTAVLRGTDGQLQRPAHTDEAVFSNVSGDRLSSAHTSVARHTATSSFSFSPSLAQPGTLEVERGVSRNLRTLGRRAWSRAFEAEPQEEEGNRSEDEATHAAAHPEQHERRQRQLALRNLGSSVLEVSLPCVSRLPASDCLGGVALGRPSAYSVLDPRTGASTRQLTAAEAALRRDTAASAATDASPQPSDEPTAPLELMEESAEDVLAILDMLENEDLGGLERFSVNTVSELVLRNQELLVQLYKTTQRAEKAEAHERTLERAVHGDKPMHAKSLISRGDGERLAPQERATLLRAGTRRRRPDSEEAEHAESPASSAGAEESGHLSGAAGATRASATATAPTTTTTATTTLPPPGQKRAHATASDDEGEQPPTASRDVLSDRGAVLVQQLMEGVLERHEATVMWEDESVAHALIDVLQTMRPLQTPSAPSHHSDAQEDAEAQGVRAQSVSFMARADAAVNEAALHSVIELCAAQAVQLARQELDVHAQRLHAVEQDGWSAAQASLQAVVNDLKATFIVPHEARLKAMQSVMQALYEGHGGGAEGSAQSLVATAAGKDSGLLRVLERLQKLLHAASLKDNSVMSALSASHRRQRAYLDRKLRKKRRVEPLQQDEAADPSSRSGIVGGVNAQASPLLAPQHTPTTSMPALSQPPPQMGSPVATEAVTSGVAGEFPVTHSPALRARSLTATAATTTTTTAMAHMVDELLEASDSDEHEAAYAALCDRLALEEAKQRGLSDELQAEKKLHLSLHERMWSLECARDDALEQVSDANARMKTMLTREEYENAVGDLDEARAQVDDLKAQLRFLHQEKNRLQMSGEALQHQLDHHEEERQRATADSRLALQQREQQLSTANELEYSLRQEITALQERQRRYEDDARMHFTQLEASESEKAQLADELEGLRRRFLADDRTQALLQALYPGDSALDANVALVQLLGREKDSLTARLAASELQVEEHKAEQVRLRDALQSAIQERQDAELALQSERAARLAGWEEDADNNNNGGEGDVDSATGEATASPLGIGSAPRLRRRVQSLEAQLRATTHEVTLLRAAEQSWKRREEELRRQLEVMSRDPVSRAVRQYGLQACHNFEMALEQMQSRLQDATEKGEAAEREVAALKEDLAAAQTAAEAQAAHATRLEASKAQAQDALEQATVELTRVREMLAARDDALAAAVAQKAALEHTAQTLTHGLREVETARDALKMELDRTETEKARFWEDNTKLMAKLRELQQDLTRVDAEKRAANAALAQGMSSASRLAGRRPRGASTAPGRPSLTGDMSMTPITPPNQRIP